MRAKKGKGKSKGKGKGKGKTPKCPKTEAIMEMTMEDYAGNVLDDNNFLKYFLLNS